jgi:DNA-binding XRE family transcriptional regulator
MQGIGQGLQGVGAQQAGYAGAGQAASNLANIGASQQQADLARMGFQNQLGGQQQQYQQGIINQAIQDYATQQQYPYMQLSTMSNLLRGLPMQGMSTQQYQAQPNLATQAISGLGTAAGAYKAFGFKEGGSVKGLAVGGMGNTAGMAQQSESAQGIKAQLMAMPADQVAQVAQTSPSETVRAMANEVLMEKRMQAQAEQQAERSIAQDQAPRGLGAAPAPSMDTLGAAGGGIVAFANEGEVEEDDKYGQYIRDVQRARLAAGVEGSPIDPKLKGMYEERIAGLGGRRESDTGLNMIDFFSRMNKPGSTLSAGIAAAGEALPGITARRKDLLAEELAATKGMSDLTLAERAEKLGISKEAMGAYEKEMDREKSLEVARIGATPRDTDFDKTTAAELALLIEQGAPNNAATKAKARTLAIEKTGLMLRKVETQEDAALTNRLKTDGKMKSLRTELLMAEDKDKPAIQAKMDQRENELRGDIKRPSAAPSDTSSGRFPKPDIAKVPNVPEGSSIGAQTDKGWEVKNKDGKVIGHIQK